MIKAVLCDLDNTLIHNPDGVFAREFIALIQTALGDTLHLADMGAVMRHIIRSLSRERTVIVSNRQMILSLLSEAAATDIAVVTQLLETFYQEQYPQLQPIVSPVEPAAALIRGLRQQNIPVVIATNPIYLASGIQQRLRWGQLDACDYALVTDADTMHFAKPDPAYYAEIIARVGVEPDEALVIGDNPVNDWQAAEQAGLLVYRVGDDPAQSLRELLTRIQAKHWRDSFQRPVLTPTAIQHALRGNQGALMGMVEQAAPYTWRQHPLPDEWSVLQIVSHLVESERVTQRVRIERILASPYNPARLVEAPVGRVSIVPLSDDLHELAAMFLQERAITLALLQSLTPADWERQAQHSIFGFTTLQEMATFTAQHDRMHIQQLCQTLGKCIEPI